MNKHLSRGPLRLLCTLSVFLWASLAVVATQPPAASAGLRPELDASNGNGRDGLQYLLAENLEEGRTRVEQPALSIDNGDTLTHILASLHVMQSKYFQLWQGTWPTAIDWTSAVMGTQVSGALSAVSRSDLDPFVRENSINQYFNHIIAFYFGENEFALLNQAYDDMLWVVLGWLEATKLMHLHSRLHYSNSSNHQAWHATQFQSAFAHRARIFWDQASQGWETSLCDGGMIWNPYLTPYKNAITNQLWIAASVSMYLYFPGDEINEPFVDTTLHASNTNPDNHAARRHDHKYLKAALEAYDWLMASNMTNAQGLFVDGFHISGWRSGRNPSNGTRKCDVRDEQVYTYNQGVILTGQRGLWEATGNATYLSDGHTMIRRVIAATGWSTENLSPADTRRWAGIGRNGILEESCDSTGRCSQDGQTFKGIFFHHMRVFCEPLQVGEKHGAIHGANKTLAAMHESSCDSYGPWVERNARAAFGTKDEAGKYGMWWTVGLRREEADLDSSLSPTDGTDYRNFGVPRDELWRLSGDGDQWRGPEPFVDAADERAWWDPNSRGRGRTVETQSGGVAVLRALYRYVR